MALERRCAHANLFLYEHEGSSHRGAKEQDCRRDHQDSCRGDRRTGFFAQVIFNDVQPGDWFMGGAPLMHDQIFVYGHIRAGRAAVDKTSMIKLMADAVAPAAHAGSARAVWVYLNELPPRQMIEFGHVLPEPGDEPIWTAALPEQDRAFMQSIAK
jgi:phenylpyruvate tautomerase PptA (4-oxalocrotonate tautomerase family)